MRVTIPLLLCLVTVQATPITSATTDDFLRLHQKLTSNYSTHMRPVLNQSESLPVRVSTRLLSVTGVDEPRQLVTIVCAVRYSWFDPFLTWDPAEYGGIDAMYLEQDNIWTPDMYQLHSPDGRGVLTELPTHHIALPSGKVTYRSTGTFTTFCNLDMTYFPYDQQTCLFKFGVLDAVLKNVELVSDGVEVSQEFVGHIEWDVEDMQLVQAVYGREDEQFSVTEVFVTLRRRPRYFEVSMIVPVSVVSFLSLPSFLVSAESGERLSYSLTVLLSLAVYVSSTSSLMPHSSIKLPLLLLYLLMLFLLSSLCVLINVLLIYLRRTGKVRLVQGSKVLKFCGFNFIIKTADVSPTYSQEQRPCMFADLGSIRKDNFQRKLQVSEDVFIIEREVHNYFPSREGDRASGSVTEMYERISGEKSKPDTCKKKEYYVNNSAIDPDLEELGTQLDKCALLIFTLSYFVIISITFFLFHFQGS